MAGEFDKLCTKAENHGLTVEVRLVGNEKAAVGTLKSMMMVVSNSRMKKDLVRANFTPGGEDEAAKNILHFLTLEGT